LVTSALALVSSLSAFELAPPLRLICSCNCATCLCVYVCMGVWVYVYVRMYVYTYVCTCMCMCTCMRMCVCVYVYVCTLFVAQPHPRGRRFCRRSFESQPRIAFSFYPST